MWLERNRALLAEVPVGGIAERLTVQIVYLRFQGLKRLEQLFPIPMNPIQLVIVGRQTMTDHV